MVLQTNPNLIWQLIPGTVLLGIMLFIRTRPVRKKESGVFSWMMFGGSLWAFANAIQLISPDIGWQILWNRVTYLGIMIIPTTWFLLSVRLTGFLRERIEKFEWYLWLPPAVLYLFALANNMHKLFFRDSSLVDVGGYMTLVDQYGILFYVHTAYSYLLLVVGIIMLLVSLATEFRKYGIQAYGLIIGVLAPLAGNAYFLFGSPPPGFPDPTPLIFTVTGIAFAWAIFGGRILEVVPLAHETIVRKLSTGVLILDADKNIRDINDAAREMLGLTSKSYAGDSLAALVEDKDIALLINEALNSSIQKDREIQATIPTTHRTFDVHISHIGDGGDGTTGWLIQFNDVSGIKQAEENLISTQATMKVVLDTLQDSFFEADRFGTITYANKAFIRNLGYTRWEDVQGKNFRYFTDRRSVREIYEKFKILYDTKKPLEPFEYSYRTREGRTLIGETTVSPIMDGEEVIGSRGLIRDVTARVKTEREILEQKELLDGLMQQSPIAMVINDMDKRITMVNPSFERLFGYSREEALGQKLDDLLTPRGDVDETQELSTIAMARHASLTGKRRKKNGTLVDVEMFAAPFHVGGERFGYLAFYNDISERLEAEANLEKTQSSYLAMVETLQDAYFEVSRAGLFTYVNKALCDKNGYAREELVGRHFRKVASRKSLRETVEKFESMFDTGEPIPQYEFIFRNKEGRELTSEMVVSPIFEGGSIVGARGLIRDISVRVQAQEILQQAKDAAESRAGELDAINRVAATVSRSLDLKDILQSVCQELTAIFEVRNAGIGLLTPDKKELEIVAFHAVDPGEKSVKGIFLPVEGNTSSMEVIRHKKTVVIQDAQTDARTSSIADLSRQRGTKSIMIVPLLARGEAIGTIGMPAKNSDHVFTANEIELAETIASQIAAAVDNAQLHTKTELALGAVERDRFCPVI
jgi:PAS domain S-box-containing protein